MESSLPVRRGVLRMQISNFKFQILHVLFFVLCAASANAVETKIGYIDTKEIFSKFKGAVEIQKQLDKEIEEWKTEEQKKKREVDSLKRELEKVALLLSVEKKKEKETFLKTKQDEYEQYVKEIWGEEGKLHQRNVELTKPVIEKINTIVRKIGDEEKFSIILDSSDGNIVYAPSSSDITQRVIDELNREEGYAPVAKGQKLKTVVYAFEEKTPEAEKIKLGKTFSEMLRANLSISEKFEPFERRKVDDYLRDQRYDPNKPVEEKKALELAKGLQADAIIVGKVTKLGSEIQVDVRILEVSTGKELTKDTGRSKDEKGLQIMAQDLIDKLSKRLP